MRTSIPPADPAENHVTGDWRHRAVCRDEDPELFFPLGEGGGHQQLAALAAQIDQAKAVCRRCPVRQACLTWALETGVDHGVFGGMDSAERRALKRHGVRPARDIAPGKSGPKPKVDVAEALRLRGFGISDAAIAVQLGVTLDSLQQAVRRANQRKAS